MLLDDKIVVIFLVHVLTEVGIRIAMFKDLIQIFIQEIVKIEMMYSEHSGQFEGLGLVEITFMTFARKDPAGNIRIA